MRIRKLALVILAAGASIAGIAHARAPVGTNKALGNYSRPYSYGWEGQRDRRCAPQRYYHAPMKYNRSAGETLGNY